MGRYDDMLDLPHHVSSRRLPMSMIDRGAQFSPFAALTGYDKVLEESARLTSTGVELTEGAMAVIDEKLRDLCSRIESRPWGRFVCFIPDERKAGGAYEAVEGNLKKYDYVEKVLILTDGRKIDLDLLVAVETE